MGNLREFALEDEMDDLIEQAAASVDDSVYSSSGDGFDEQAEEVFDTDDVLDLPAPQDASPSLGRPAGTVYHTHESLSGGLVTHGSDGSTFQTFKNVLSEGTTTHGPDGSYQTVKNVLSGGSTTYGPNGVTYRTEKKLFGEGSVTYGSDGSKFETTPDMFGGGSTTRET